MKHKLLLTVGIVLMALVGCVQDVDVIVPQAPAPDGAIAINISGSIDQTYTTRVDDGGFCDGVSNSRNVQSLVIFVSCSKRL